MRKLGFGKIAGLLALFFLAAAAASSAQTFTSLKVFTASNSPRSLVQSTNGNLFGTTFGGANNAYGTVFEMTPGGELLTLYRFCTKSGCPDGNGPMGGLVQGSKGNFYGVTYYGGTGTHCPANSGGCGTIFEITPGGALTTLYKFCSQANCADGAYPQQLIFGADGNLYGTTTGYNGYPRCVGVSQTGCGTIFEITPAGKLTTIHEFCSETNCADGYGSFAGLTRGTDGNFYGSTVYGGANNGGTVFKITPQGALTTLHAFCALAGCADGQQPIAPLVQAADGSFYGTTSIGGANIHCDADSIGCGTIFNITSEGNLTTLYSFCPVAGCADGSLPQTLTLGTDGNFYGTAAQGGVDGFGSLFQVTPGGSFNSLYSFFCSASNCSDGADPVSLLQATNGTFYGTTSNGGNYVNSANPGDGVAYSWSMGLGPFVEAQTMLPRPGR